MLTQNEIQTVKADWQSVLPKASAAATLFYDRVFELDPDLRGLFKPDLSEQKKKLVLMLGAAVHGLDDLPTLVPVVQALGRRHAGYGVQPQHYATVGSALIWTLTKGLGDGFDADHQAAWLKVYDLLAKTMMAAAEEAKADGAPTLGRAVDA
jgi:hemoglobin-like flavoprotein